MKRSARDAHTPPHRRAARRRSPVFTLAYWQLRQTWRLLLVIGVGLIAAVILICAVPLYSQISESAELQNALNQAGPGTSDILVTSQAQTVAPDNIQNMQSTLNQEFHTQLGPFINFPVQFSSELDDNSIFLPQVQRNHKLKYINTPNLLDVIGAEVAQARAHLTLLQGRLPANNSNALEIDITASTAHALHVKIGSTLAIQIAFDNGGQRVVAPYLNLLVVGIFSPKAADPFWHGQDFECSSAGEYSILCESLVSNDAFITMMSQISGSIPRPPYPQTVSLESPPSLLWYYELNFKNINVTNISALQNGLARVAADVTGFTNPPYIAQTTITDNAYNILSQYTNRNTVVQIPITSLSLLVVGLTLFFVITMTDILVDRQTETIAVLRSRGASRLQIFSALIVQNIGLCLLALIVGPLVAILVVPIFSLATLPHSDVDAINVLTSNLLATIQLIAVPTLITLGVALLAMALAVGGAVQRGILAVRREAARSTHRPLWERLNVDVVAGIIAFVGFGFSLYESSPGVLNEQVRVLVLPPLTLAGVVFLLLGVSLFLLRAFPLILRWGTKLALRNRGAAPMLAVAQMARAPRQSLRMTILLAFAIAFAIFALIFNASQSQRIFDVANFEVGADFNGQLSSASNLVLSSTYSHLPGVQSATVGYSSFPTATEGGQDYSVELLAADANTFAHTFIWTSQDSQQSIAPLMQRLVALRAQAKQTTNLPAIVDAAAVQTLHLLPNNEFEISDANGTVTCYMIAEVQRIPTVNDSAFATGTNGFSAAGGILVDFQSYAAVLQKATGTVVTPNNVWVKSGSDAKSLASVRRELFNGPMALNDVNDRRAIITNLSNDPLYLDLTGLLVIGTVIAILLAVAGNLIASWLSVRSRLTSFAVLRALGTAPGQLAGILTWEQSIIYVIALVLGVVFGVLLSALALPSLIFTNVAVSGFNGNISSGQYYILQTVPPIEVVVPPALWIIVAIIIAVCAVALVMMVRVAARPSISQTLRLNED
jgi:putative ABC transport system permease protein